MAPGGRRFWFPLLRLTAFVSAVVVVGNVLFLALYTHGETESASGRDTDFLGRSRRRLEKKFRNFQKFFFGSPEASVPAPVEGSGAIWFAAPEFELLAQAEPIADARVPESGLPVVLAASAPEAFPVDPLPFVYPKLPPPPPRLPLELSSLEPLLTPETIAAFYRSAEGNFLEDFGDSILKGPETLLDSLLHCAGKLLGRSGSVSLLDEASVTERIFEVQVGRRDGRLSSELFTNWIDREQRFLARFADSELLTFGVQDGTEEVNLDDLRREQGKVLWDAVKKTYLSKYKFKGEDRIREDAFYLDQWRGADFVAVPSLFAAYVWFRGFEKRISLGDTWARVSMEPLQRWVSGKDDMSAGVSVEWGIKGIPVALIVSAGRFDGKTELDFIGIGTSVGMVRKALALQQGD